MPLKFFFERNLCVLFECLRIAQKNISFLCVWDIFAIEANVHVSRLLKSRPRRKYKRFVKTEFVRRFSIVTDRGSTPRSNEDEMNSHFLRTLYASLPWFCVELDFYAYFSQTFALRRALTRSKMMRVTLVWSQTLLRLRGIRSHQLWKCSEFHVQTLRVKFRGLIACWLYESGWELNIARQLSVSLGHHNVYWSSFSINFVVLIRLYRLHTFRGQMRKTEASPFTPDN